MSLRPMLVIPVLVFLAAPIASHAGAPAGVDTVVRLLARLDDPAAQADVLRGMSEALEGRRNVRMPAGWHGIYSKLEASPNAEVRETAIRLALLFGDADAVAALRERASDAGADSARRRDAIEALVRYHDPSMGPTLLALLDDPALRAVALRGLAAYAEPQTPKAILRHYSSFNESERHDAINTLASRAPWAVDLLDAVEKGQVPHADVSAFTMRQLSGLNDRALSQRLKTFYGAVRPPARDKAALIATYKKTFTPDLMAKADPSHGRAIFNKTCAMCHTLFDTGGKVGPELTGSQRANLDYLLENVVDPSAVVAKEYYMTVVETNDGRTLTGIVKHEDNTSLTLRNTTEDIALPKTDIKKRNTSPVSMMPEGLLEALSMEDARDLLAYLESPHQVPAKDEKANP